MRKDYYLNGDKLKKFESVENIVVTGVETVFIGGDTSKLKAICKVCLNDCIQLTLIRVYKGDNGLFVSYPLHHGESDVRQMFYPTKRSVREYIDNCILYTYSEMMERI